MLKKSLKQRQSPLSSSELQLNVLANGIFKDGDLPPFKANLVNNNLFPLKPNTLEILQINLGYMCNQVCAHCHVDAGPDRKEIMSKETMQLCLEVLKKSNVTTLDLSLIHI